MAKTKSNVTISDRVASSDHVTISDHDGSTALLSPPSFGMPWRPLYVFSVGHVKGRAYKRGPIAGRVLCYQILNKEGLKRNRRPNVG